MDFVLVFPLILAFLSPVKTDTKESSDSCYAQCPPGYYKADDNCSDPAARYRCKKCENGTFTAINNTSSACLRCGSCGHLEITIKPCSFDSDVVCECQEGYYYAKSNDCQSCSCQHCKRPVDSDYTTKCKPCRRCLNNSECWRKCEVTKVPPSTNPPPTTSSASSTAPSMSTRDTAAKTTASNSTSNPEVDPVPHAVNQMPWPFLMGVVVMFLFLFLLLLYFTMNTVRYPFSCLCWRVNKDPELPVEDRIFNEQRSHQGSSQTTLTLNISEETPMMTLTRIPATPEHPAHIGTVPSDAEHKAAGQDEQSEQWPAIVLYAIIKEVPLRRWKEFLRLLSVADHQLERVELESGLGLGSMERQYQMLRLWSQRSSASLNDVFSALQYMDLSGCAQLLQESLEKLQWRHEPK